MLNLWLHIQASFVAQLICSVDRTCFHNNVTYPEGATYPAGDDCNNW